MARQLAMYFSKKYTESSLAVIGKQCGNKDHSTVIHSNNTIENLLDTNKQFKALVSDIEKNIC
mgnify:CR=1 FL=1